MEERITTVVCPCCGDEIEVVVNTDVETVATEKSLKQDTSYRTREKSQTESFDSSAPSKSGETGYSRVVE